MTTGQHVIGYVRVSTAEQEASGAGLAAQRAAIEEECARREWILDAIGEDALSARDTKRPGLQAVLCAVERVGGPRALVVAKLDRLSRSLIDFATLVERSRKRGWEIVVLDLAVDTTTPNGEAMAGMLAVFAQWERRLIGERTRAALAVKRAEGVRLGRAGAPAATVARVVELRAEGWSLPRVAVFLNDEGVPTPQGGLLWRPSSVASVLKRAGASVG